MPAASEPRTIRAHFLAHGVLRSVIRPLLFAAGLVFFATMIALSWKQTRLYLVQTKWHWFLLSLALGLLDHLVGSRVFHQLLRKFGIAQPYAETCKMYFYGQAAKYIPGRLWNVLFHRSYVDNPNSTLLLLIVNVEHMLMFLLRNVALGASMLLLGVSWILALPLYVLPGALFEGIGRSRKFLHGLLWLMTRLKLSQASESQSLEDSFGRDETPLYSLYYLLATLTYIVPSLLFLYAVFDMPPTVSWTYAALFSLSWVAGVLAFVVPAGIGVREGVFVFLASLSGQNASIESLTAIAVVYRFWHILQEAAAISLTWLLTRLIAKRA